MSISHIRKPVPPRRGNSFYRDKTDYTRFAATLCGAEVTDRDVDYRYAGTKKCQRAMELAQWPICNTCMVIRKAIEQGRCPKCGEFLGDYGCVTLGCEDC